MLNKKTIIMKKYVKKKCNERNKRKNNLTDIDFY